MAKDWRTLGTCAPEVPTPRGRSTERASSIRGPDLRQNEGDWFGLPQRRVGHEGLEVARQVLTPRSAAHTLSHTPAIGHTPSRN